jgi:hypothetical protein
MTKLRDKFWLWGQSPNAHTSHKVPTSRMTAMEGCTYLGIDRCCRVVMLNHPRPPFDQHSIAMEPLKEVVWSIIGAGGSECNDDGQGDIDEVLRQAEMFPNITGGVLDDFFFKWRMELFPPENIKKINEKLKTGCSRPLDLWCVVYDHQLDLPIQEYLEHCDIITFWTWKSENLAKMEENFKRLCDMTPDKKHMVGCYMYDYGNNQAMSLETMKMQCAKYEEWLKDGTADGIIICSNCCADVGLETVAWTKNWLKKIGG